MLPEALAELFPHDPPRFMARTPHGYHDAEQIRRELNAAGFGNISRKSKASSPRDPATSLIRGVTSIPSQSL